ncbi:TIGR02206 family membrane protein [Mycoplasmatota bacterium WC44]
MIRRFFGYDINQELTIQVFTWQHYTFIIVALLTAILTLRYANKVRNSKHEKTILNIVFFILIGLESSYHIHNWLRYQFSVPLHLCSFSMILSMLLLKTKNIKYFELLFFIGPLGGFTALVFPEMGGFTYLNFRYYSFIISHLFIIAIPLYFYQSYGMRVNKQSLKKTYIFLISLLPVIYMVNRIFGMNYIFVNKKPKLELVANNIPEWPYYLILFIVFAFSFIFTVYKVSNMRKFNEKY